MRHVFTAVVFIALVGAGLYAGARAADEPVQLMTDSDKISYSVGYQVGGDFKSQGVELNSKAMLRGVQDALSGGAPLMEQEAMRRTLIDLKRKVVAVDQAKKRQDLTQRIAEGRKFLEENAKKEGVVSLPSGLQYKVIGEGTGKTPGPKDTVTVHYKGTLIDGTEFDSSYRRNEPATFRVDGVIKGWTEALQLMKEGAKWQLFIPPDLAYGERGPLADRTLLFDVELISVQ